MRSSDIIWTSFSSHAGRTPASGGGTWCLTIDLRAGFDAFAWRIEHSGGNRGLRTGSTSNVNFIKALAELAITDLEAAI